jgi:hypothetical protein
MMKISAFLPLLCFNSVHPQNNSFFRFSSVNQMELPEMASIVTVTQQSMNLEVVGEPPQEAAKVVQCLYDFQGNRVNKGCVTAERPPRCESGSLVQTLVGNEHEMCCCNFANVA